MPGRVVHHQEAPPARLGRHRLGQLVQKELEHIGVHALKDQGEASAALRTDRPDYIGPEVVA
jgi:hypothetical protein